MLRAGWLSRLALVSMHLDGREAGQQNRPLNNSLPNCVFTLHSPDRL